MDLDADLLNGELYLKFKKDAHHNIQLTRQPGLLLDMLLFAKRMG